MLNEAGGILDAFLFELNLLGSLCSSGIGQNESDGLSLGWKGTLWLVEGSKKPEVVSVGNLAWPLRHVSQVGACCPGCNSGPIVQQDGCLDRLPGFIVAVFISFKRLQPGDGLISEDQIKFSDLFLVLVPTGAYCSCFEPVNEVCRGDGHL